MSTFLVIELLISFFLPTESTLLTSSRWVSIKYNIPELRMCACVRIAQPVEQLIPLDKPEIEHFTRQKLLNFRQKNCCSKLGGRLLLSLLFICSGPTLAISAWTPRKWGEMWKENRGNFPSFKRKSREKRKPLDFLQKTFSWVLGEVWATFAIGFRNPKFIRDLLETDSFAECAIHVDVLRPCLHPEMGDLELPDWYLIHYPTSFIIKFSFMEYCMPFSIFIGVLQELWFLLKKGTLSQYFNVCSEIEYPLKYNFSITYTW